MKSLFEVIVDGEKKFNLQSAKALEPPMLIRNRIFFVSTKLIQRVFPGVELNLK